MASHDSFETVMAELRAAAVPGLVLGFVNAALPFTLIAWGEKHIDSGVAAIANATVPLFVVLLAIRYRPSERATGGRLVRDAP
jgi:drug/metabolite transporter (DMT)-like permease